MPSYYGQRWYSDELYSYDPYEWLVSKGTVRFYSDAQMAAYKYLGGYATVTFYESGILYLWKGLDASSSFSVSSAASLRFLAGLRSNDGFQFHTDAELFRAAERLVESYATFQVISNPDVNVQYAMSSPLQTIEFSSRAEMFGGYPWVPVDPGGGPWIPVGPDMRPNEA